MPASPLISPLSRWNPGPSLLIALLLTCFLLFIDEGAYNFRWMSEPGNWIFFVLYAGMLWLGQLIAYRFLFTRYNYRLRTLLAALIGIPLGVGFLILLAVAGYSLIVVIQ